MQIQRYFPNRSNKGAYFGDYARVVKSDAVWFLGKGKENMGDIGLRSNNLCRGRIFVSDFLNGEEIKVSVVDGISIISRFDGIEHMLDGHFAGKDQIEALIEFFKSENTKAYF